MEPPVVDAADLRVGPEHAEHPLEPPEFRACLPDEALELPGGHVVVDVNTCCRPHHRERRAVGGLQHGHNWSIADWSDLTYASDTAVAPDTPWMFAPAADTTCELRIGTAKSS